MKIRALVATLAFGLGLSAAAAATAGVTIQTSNFISSPSAFNGFEGIGTLLYNGNTPYSEGGITVQYVGGQLATTTLKPHGTHDWTPVVGALGYTDIKLTNGRDFDAIQFLAGTSVVLAGTGLEYQLLNDGAVVQSGYAGLLGKLSSPLTYYGFSGDAGTVFDEVRLENRRVLKTFSPNDLDRLVVDDIAIHAVAAVPEPGVWAMMIIGFGAIGAAARSRRRTAALAA